MDENSGKMFSKMFFTLESSRFSKTNMLKSPALFAWEFRNEGVSDVGISRF